MHPDDADFEARIAVLDAQLRAQWRHEAAYRVAEPAEVWRQVREALDELGAEGHADVSRRAENAPTDVLTRS